MSARPLKLAQTLAHPSAPPRPRLLAFNMPHSSRRLNRSLTPMRLKACELLLRVSYWVANGHLPPTLWRRIMVGAGLSCRHPHKTSRCLCTRGCRIARMCARVLTLCALLTSTTSLLRTYLPHVRTCAAPPLFAPSNSHPPENFRTWSRRHPGAPACVARVYPCMSRGADRANRERRPSQ
jgi:hypothetical protein